MLTNHVVKSPQYQTLSTHAQVKAASKIFSPEPQLLPSVTKSKAYNDNYRSLENANEMIRLHMKSNKSIQYLDTSKSMDFNTQEESNTLQTPNNVVTFKSPDYLLNDGSLVNLEHIDHSVHHDSSENLANL